MQIDESGSQAPNAFFPMHERLEPVSKMMLERDRQPLRQPRPRQSTEDGMQMDESEVHAANAAVSIHKSFEPDSNVTRERPACPEKHA
jgi:hypothetical protein